MLKRVAFHVHLAAHLQAAPIFLLSNLKTSLAKKHAPPNWNDRNNKRKNIFK